MMSEERRKILDMLSEGKITAAEADQLLSAPGEGGATSPTESGAVDRKPKFLRIQVVSGGRGGAPGSEDRVNLRVPMQLLRSGVKLANLMPGGIQDKVSEALSEHGLKVDLKNLRPDDLEELLIQLGEITIDVNDKDEQVRIFCE